MNESGLKIREVAELLRLGTRTITNWCRDKRIPAVKIGRGWRIAQSTIDALLRGEITIEFDKKEETHEADRHR